jgi:uracil-DNA glycosylase
MATSSGNRVVYLEDLEQPSSQATSTPTDAKSVTTSSDHNENVEPKEATSTSAITGKRQRTLFDMLGSTPGQSSEKNAKKKPKLAASNSSDKPSVAESSGGSPGSQSLNSIPFSLSDYVDSLTDDQKRLLKLECETMGKSW